VREKGAGGSSAEAKCDVPILGRVRMVSRVRRGSRRPMGQNGDNMCVRLLLAFHVGGG
jgi:hypothetical protein